MRIEDCNLNRILCLLAWNWVQSKIVWPKYLHPYFIHLEYCCFVIISRMLRKIGLKNEDLISLIGLCLEDWDEVQIKIVCPEYEHPSNLKEVKCERCKTDSSYANPYKVHRHVTNKRKTFIFDLKSKKMYFTSYSFVEGSSINDVTWILLHYLS
jgi:hypothetical protein